LEGSGQLPVRALELRQVTGVQGATCISWSIERVSPDRRADFFRRATTARSSTPSSSASP